MSLENTLNVQKVKDAIKINTLSLETQLCKYCNLRSSNLCLHRCKKANNAARQKIKNEIIPVLVILTSKVIYKMQKNENQEFVPHTEQLIESSIKSRMRDHMMQYQPIAQTILRSSVNQLFQMTHMYNVWARACLDIIYTLQKNGIEFHGDERLDEILKNELSLYTPKPYETKAIETKD